MRQIEKSGDADTGDHNAWLMAKAPDMLAAIEAALRIVTCGGLLGIPPLPTKLTPMSTWHSRPWSVICGKQFREILNT